MSEAAGRAIVTALVTRSAEIRSASSAQAVPAPARVGRRRAATGYAWALVSVAGVTALGSLARPYVDVADIIMLYLLAIMVTAVWFGRGPSLATAVLSVAAFDLFFFPPYYTFAVADARYVLTFAFMLALGVVISGLTERVRMQAEAARAREQRTAILYSLSRELSQLGDRTSIGSSAARHVAELAGGAVAVLLAGPDGELAPLAGTTSEWARASAEQDAARLAFARADGVVFSAQALHIPLVAAGRPIGVLGVAAPERSRAAQELLVAMSGQVAIALHRVMLAEEAQQAELRARTEELRAALLGSVSHDLRTPLTAISTAASVLLQHGAMPEAKRREFAGTIYDEAQSLGRRVTNLLHLTRLETTDVPLRRDWAPLEDPIGAALGRLEAALAGRDIQVRLPPELPPVFIDEVLIEHLVLNVLENAAKYTPAGSPIEIRAGVEGATVVVEVLDRGPGLPAGHEALVFEKFVRAAVSPGGGFGLGLAICRAIALAHGGAMTAANREGGGAVFRVALPVAGPI